MIKKDIDFLFDKRIIERNLKSNKITNEELNNHINKLIDLKDQCVDIADLFFNIKADDKKIR